MLTFIFSSFSILNESFICHHVSFVSGKKLPLLFTFENVGFPPYGYLLFIFGFQQIDFDMSRYGFCFF